jgi:hypothetical protein
MWRKFKTSLKVSLFVKGKPDEVLMGRIFCADFEASQVGLSNPLVMHSGDAFDLEDCEFSIEESRLVATRNESDWIVFEEIGELLPIWRHPMR